MAEAVHEQVRSPHQKAVDQHEVGADLKSGSRVDPPSRSASAPARVERKPRPAPEHVPDIPVGGSSEPTSLLDMEINNLLADLEE
jgi:hypothetical protein